LTLRVSNPSSDAIDIYKLLNLQHRLADPAQARAQLDRFADHVEAAVTQFEDGLILGEARRRGWPRQTEVIEPISS